jgi:transposase
LSLRPRSGEQVPPLTAQVARASNPGGTTAIWVRDRLDGLWCDEDFAAWYPRDGRPGLSPAQLATVCVLQFLLGLSDRQAAEAVRCRIDFKYAMAMELDDPGFHHSVLADFRDRLAEGDRADRLLDLALARLKEAGLVRERTTQRTDSTHVLAAVRDLTRLELITEAVRAALEEVAGTSPHLLDELVDEDWGRRYGRPVRLGKNPTKPKTRILATGNDAVRLLEHLYRHGADRTSALSGILDGRAQLPRVRQDFDRGISFWSRKVWKAVGGLGEEASSVAGWPLRRSMFHGDGREDVLQVGFRLSSVAAVAHAVSVGELVDGALDSGADRVAGLPVGGLLGVDAELQVAEFSWGKAHGPGAVGGGGAAGTGRAGAALALGEPGHDQRGGGG